MFGYAIEINKENKVGPVVQFVHSLNSRITDDVKIAIAFPHLVDNSVFKEIHVFCMDKFRLDALIVALMPMRYRYTCLDERIQTAKAKPDTQWIAFSKENAYRKQTQPTEVDKRIRNLQQRLLITEKSYIAEAIERDILRLETQKVTRDSNIPKPFAVFINSSSSDCVIPVAIKVVETTNSSKEMLTNYGLSNNNHPFFVPVI